MSIPATEDRMNRFSQVTHASGHQMQPDKRQPMVKDRKPYECEKQTSNIVT